MIVGVEGAAGVGKDTLAARLVEAHGFERIALADPMKRMVRDAFGWDDRRLWGPSAAREEPDLDRGGLSARVALQLLGTEWGRRCWPNVWIDIALRDARGVLAGWSYTKERGLSRAMPQHAIRGLPTGVVIPDVRFRNEMEAVHAAGGKVVRIKRDLGRARGSVGVVGHASEVEAAGIPDSEFDFVVEAREGVPAFHEQIDALAARLVAGGSTNEGRAA